MDFHLNFGANESKEDWLKDDPHLAKSVAHWVVICPTLPACELCDYHNLIV